MKREISDPFKNNIKVGQLGIYEPDRLRTLVRLGIPSPRWVPRSPRSATLLHVTFRAREQMLQGANSSQLSGPLGIAKTFRPSRFRQLSMALIQLAALLSVSIGLVNLFPIPLLDGGHLLYYACEGVLGRPLGERAQDVGFRLGLAVVLGIFILATWNDLVRLNLF